MVTNLVYEKVMYQDEKFTWNGSLKLYNKKDLENPIKEYTCTYKVKEGALELASGDNLEWLVDSLISNKFLELSVYKKSIYVNKFLHEILNLNERCKE